MKRLGQIHVDAIEKRGISAETATRFGLYSGRANGPEVIPDEAGNVLAFPYLERGFVVSEKYRAPQKKFWQKTGGRKTFWNAEVLDDPALASGQAALIITEGEFDALAAIDCGFPFTVSVPDGAPAVRDGERPEDIPALDKDRDPTGKFEYVYNNRDALKRIQRIIIASDNDPPGQRLAAELVRRLTAVKCSFLEYPAGCKDINDVLVKQGRDAVVALLHNAKPYPVHGIYRLSDFPDLPPIPVFSTGWPPLDQNLKIFAGEFMVTTGVPGSGKSTWVLNLILNLYRNYGWRSAIYSPEMPTVPHLRDKLRRMIGGRADDVINDALVFIDADPTRQNDDADFSLEWVLEKATDALLRYGIRMLLIDPWNEIEHARKPGESTTEYIGKSIRQIKRFARQYEVSIIVIAHPVKDINEKGKVRVPNLYDVEGSAAWANKADHGICIHRPDPYRNETSIFIQKVRFEETGEKGEIKMAFDRSTSTYGPLQDQQNGVDFEN